MMDSLREQIQQYAAYSQQTVGATASGSTSNHWMWGHAEVIDNKPGTKTLQSRLLRRMDNKQSKETDQSPVLKILELLCFEEKSTKNEGVSKDGQFMRDQKALEHRMSNWDDCDSNNSPVGDHYNDSFNQNRGGCRIGNRKGLLPDRDREHRSREKQPFDREQELLGIDGRGPNSTVGRRPYSRDEWRRYDHDNRDFSKADDRRGLLPDRDREKEPFDIEQELLGIDGQGPNSTAGKRSDSWDEWKAYDHDSRDFSKAGARRGVRPDRDRERFTREKEPFDREQELLGIDGRGPNRTFGRRPYSRDDWKHYDHDNRDFNKADDRRGLLPDRDREKEPFDREQELLGIDGRGPNSTVGRRPYSRDKGKHYDHESRDFSKADDRRGVRPDRDREHFSREKEPFDREQELLGIDGRGSNSTVGRRPYSRDEWKHYDHDNRDFSNADDRRGLLPDRDREPLSREKEPFDREQELLGIDSRGPNSTAGRRQYSRDKWKYNHDSRDFSKADDQRGLVPDRDGGPFSREKEPADSEQELLGIDGCGPNSTVGRRSYSRDEWKHYDHGSRDFSKAGLLADPYDRSRHDSYGKNGLTPYVEDRFGMSSRDIPFDDKHMYDILKKEFLCHDRYNLKGPFDSDPNRYSLKGLSDRDPDPNNQMPFSRDRWEFFEREKKPPFRRNDRLPYGRDSFRSRNVHGMRDASEDLSEQPFSVKRDFKSEGHEMMGEHSLRMSRDKTYESFFGPSVRPGSHPPAVADNNDRSPVMSHRHNWDRSHTGSRAHDRDRSPIMSHHHNRDMSPIRSLSHNRDRSPMRSHPPNRNKSSARPCSPNRDRSPIRSHSPNRNKSSAWSSSRNRDRSPKRSRTSSGIANSGSVSKIAKMEQYPNATNIKRIFARASGENWKKLYQPQHLRSIAVRAVETNSSVHFNILLSLNGKGVRKALGQAFIEHFPNLQYCPTENKEEFETSWEASCLG